MRISVAAVAALVHTLPVVSTSYEDITNAPVHLETRRVPPRFGEAWRKRLGHQKPRALKNIENTTDAVECDPTAEVDADIGILACGDGEQYYCMESRDSKLGGVCVETDSVPMTARALFAGGYYERTF